MATDISFDDLIPPKQQGSAASSKGTDISFDDLVPSKGSTESNIKRTAVEAIIPTGTALGGFAAGMTVAAPYAAAAGTALAATGVGAPFAIPVAAAIEFGGGFGGAMAASGAARWLQDLMHKTYAPEDYAQRQREKEAHPTSTFLTELGVGMVGMSPKTAVTAMSQGASKVARLAATPAGQRTISGGIQGGLEAGTELASEGKIEPWKVATATAAGAAMPGFNVAGRIPFAAGQKVGEKISSVLPGGVKPIKPTVSDLPPKPPEGSPPEEVDAYVKKLEAIKAERDSKAPIVEAAIRNKETGNIERMGPKHDEQRKLDTFDTHEQGFMDERGNFLTRQEAVDRAKTTNQIPQDHVLEIPEDGLHSGDLRKAGDKRFEITGEQPAGTPKPPVDLTQKPFDPNELISRQDFKTAIDNKEYRQGITLEIDMVAAERNGDTKAIAELKAEDARLTAELKQLRKDIPAVKFADINKPTWVELHDHLWGAKNIGEALDRVVDTPSLGTVSQRILAKALNKSDFIRSARLELSNDPLKYVDKSGAEQQDASGMYTGGDTHLVQLGQQGNVRTLLHEAVHAGTHRLLNEKGSAAAIKMQELFDTYQAARGKEVSPITGEPYYGFEDVHEFTAEAFTSKSFQKLLSGISVGQQPKGVLNNLWGAFKETVRQINGIPEGARTAFDEVMDSGISMLKKSEQFTPRADFATGVPSKGKAIPEDKIDRGLKDKLITTKEALDLYRQAGAQDKVINLEKKLVREEYLNNKVQEDGLASLNDREILEYQGIKIDASKNELLKEAKTLNERIGRLEKRYKEQALSEKAVEDPQILQRSLRGLERLESQKDIANRLIEIALNRDVILQKQFGDKFKPTSAPSKAVSSPDELPVDKTKTDPRDVKSEDEFYDIAADIFEKHGKVAAVEFYEGYKEYKKTWLEPIKETEKFVGINIQNKLANERIIHNETSDMMKDISDPARREAIAEAVDKGDLSGLNPEETALAKKYEALVKDIGNRAVNAGVVKGLLEDYVTHIIDWRGAPRGAREEFVQALLGTTARDPSMRGMSTESKFGKERKFKTFADLEWYINEANTRIAAAGKSDFRLQIKTKDIAEIYKEYALSMEKAIENKNLVDNLKQVRNVNGETLIKEVSKNNPMPPGWQMMDSPQFAGYAVHPDMMPALKFVFDAGPGEMMKAIGAISQLTKRINVIGSFFHAKSLMEVMSSAQIPIWTPLKEAIVLPLVERGVKAVTGKDVQLSAISKAVEQFRNGGVGESVDLWIRDGGLVLETPEDVAKGILSATGKFADSMIGKYGPKTRILESSLSTVEKYTLGLFDKYTWDYLHTGGKLMVANAYLDKARIQASKEGKPFDETAARKEISRFVNDSFGGLNWFDAATQTQNEFAKRMAMATYSPEGRRALQIALFAPDWTISTLRAFTAALPKGLNPTKWQPVEGVKGMMVPTTKADYARLYQFKTALTYLTLVNAINLMTADRPIWENKDPTRIEWPDGTSMQAMKHAMEPYHWIMDPDKTLSNKLGFIPKAAIVGIGGLEYASPDAPKLVDRSAMGRLKAVGQMVTPFQIQAAAGAPEGEGAKRAALGTLGFPVYGATPEQRKAARAEREKLLKKQAREYHEKAKRKGWEK